MIFCKSLQSNKVRFALFFPGPSSMSHRGNSSTGGGAGPSTQQVDPTSEATAMIRASRSPSPTFHSFHPAGGAGAGSVVDAAAFLISSTSVGTPLHPSVDSPASAGLPGSHITTQTVDLDNDLSVPSPYGPNSPVLFLSQRSRAGQLLKHSSVKPRCFLRFGSSDF